MLAVPGGTDGVSGIPPGTHYRPTGQGAYIGTRPSKASVQSICRKISEWTSPRNGQLSREEMVERLNRCLTGWANYFRLGQVSPGIQRDRPPRGPAAAPVAVSEAQGEDGKYVLFPDRRLYGGVRSCAPGADDDKPSVGEGMICTESRMRENRTSGLTSGGRKRDYAGD